jgi:hypothetical protein
VTTTAAPFGGHLLHAVPLLVPVVATAVVLLPDALRHGRRALWRKPTAPPSGVLLLAAVATVVAALVHLVVLPEHTEESLLYGVFFAVLAVGQGTFAWIFLLGPSRFPLVTGALGNVGAIALWLLTRTVGLPFGPFAGQVEPVGSLDLTAVASELLVVFCCLVLLGRQDQLRTPAAIALPT